MVQESTTAGSTKGGSTWGSKHQESTTAYSTIEDPTATNQELPILDAKNSRNNDQ